MVIYITQKIIHDKHKLQCDCLEQNYMDYFLNHPLMPRNALFIPVPNHLQQAQTLFKTIPPKWIIFSGGNNLNPKDWGQAVELDDLALRRDEVERYLFEVAVQQKIPILAICRGFQHVNVLSGGRVTLFLKDHPPGKSHGAVYQNKTYTVNSYHSHGIMLHDLAKVFKPIVTDKTQAIVEGYDSEGEHVIVGFQWHPERAHTSHELFTLIYEHFLKNAQLIS